jgi:hypothetical protein
VRSSHWISSNKQQLWWSLFFFFKPFFFRICHLLQNADFSCYFQYFRRCWLRSYLIDICDRIDEFWNCQQLIEGFREVGRGLSDWRIANTPLPLHTMSCVTCCVTTQGRMNERYVIRHVESALRVFVFETWFFAGQVFFTKKKNETSFFFSYLSAF